MVRLLYLYVILSLYTKARKMKRKPKKNIKIYCLCEQCGSYFDVTESRLSKYCSRKCRDKVYNDTTRKNNKEN